MTGTREGMQMGTPSLHLGLFSSMDGRGDTRHEF